MEVQTNRGADQRRVGDGMRTYEVMELWDRHQEIIRRLFLGQSAKDIAKDLDITEATVSNTRNSGLGKRALADLHNAANDDAVDVSKRIKSVAPKAVKVLEDMLNYQLDVGYELPSDRKNASSIAFGLLDRAGHAPVHRALNVNVPVSGSIIDEIKQRAVQAGAITEPKSVQDAENAKEVKIESED